MTVRHTGSNFDRTTAIVLVLGASGLLLPLYLTFTVASTPAEQLLSHGLPLVPGSVLGASISVAWDVGGLGRALVNSFAVSALVTMLKLTLGLLTAFALVFFRVPFQGLAFGLILLTQMLPLEARIAPTFGLAADVLLPVRRIAEGLGGALPWHWSLLDSYAGLTLPLAAAATATFLFRQVFLTISPSLLDAARVDGVPPLRFLWDIALPLSRNSVTALATVTFITAWNQYLWPLLITTDPSLRTAVLAVAQLVPDPLDPLPAWNVTMAGVLIVVTPPLLVAMLFHRALSSGMTSGAPR